jgi:EAL domain-containing protein (putative c-di-GMP-specific phosphodiesterase class I)
MATADPRSHTRRENLGDQALALVQFERLFQPNGIVPHVQPIVELASRKMVAYEVLARSRLIGLEMPKAMFDTAAELGLATELSEAIRLQAISESSLLPSCPHLFLNTYPNEVCSARFIEHCALLRRQASSLRMTIEVHETAITNIDQMVRLRKDLDDLNFTLAFDDFGVGQARLAELTAVNPRYLKFDRSMIQNIHAADASRKTMIASLVAMAKDIGITPLAECIETAEEVEACLELGFLLGQGYFFGHPKAIADSSR